jgi:hypothetical protein
MCLSGTNMHEQLLIHFNNLKLPLHAQEWLLNFWDVIQGLDDWRDNDAVDATEKELVIYKVMVAMPSNPFFQQHANHLLPIVSNLVLKWIAANKLEDNKEDLHKAYMWRAAYYDLILEVVRLVHGYVEASIVSDYVAKMYGETFEDYVKEFKNA